MTMNISVYYLSTSSKECLRFEWNKRTACCDNYYSFRLVRVSAADTNIQTDSDILWDSRPNFPVRPLGFLKKFVNVTWNSPDEGAQS